MATRITERAATLLAALLLTTACPDSADRAAKKRIFSPEQPSKVSVAAGEAIDIGRLASDPAALRHVVTMPGAEAVERLGPHRLNATASFDWSLGQKGVRLSEQRVVEQASVTDYHVKSENDRDYGLEVIHLGTRTFAKAKYQHFRERLRDRGQAEAIREDVYGGLRTMAGLLDNRLAVSADGEEKVAGRRARRFLFALAKEPLWASGSADVKLPPLQLPAKGPDAQTQRRLDFAQRRVPRSVDGRLWVDAETGVPLKVELTAVVAAPGEDEQQATLTLKLRQEVEAVGQKLAIAAPKDFLPDEDRPDGIAATLKRFGMGRADAGTSEAPAEPDTTEE